MLRLFMWVYILVMAGDMGLWRPLTRFGVDYDKHWQAARAVLEGNNCYLGGNLWVGFNYPQASAYAFCWLGLFSVETAEKVWKMTLLALLIGAGWIIMRRCRPPAPLAAQQAQGAFAARLATWRHWRLVSAFTLSAYLPATSGLYQGNIDPLNAVLAVAMLGGVLAGAPLAAGVCWTLLVLVKMVPLALIVPVVLWRQWRILYGFGLTLTAYFVLLLVTGRLGYEWFFVREVIPPVPVWWRTISVSPLGFFMKAAGQWANYNDPYVFLRVNHIFLAIMGPLYVGLLLWLRRRGVGWLRGLEAAMIFYPILSPLLEYHHYVWILPALILQIRRWVMGELPSRRAFAFLAGWGLLYAGYTNNVQNLMVYFGDWVHFGSVPGYMSLFLLSLWDVLWPSQSSSFSSSSSNI